MSARKVATNKQLNERARRVIPGGVNSPVRAFKAVGGEPLFICHATGSRLYTQDGRMLIDCIGSWGPMILGHGHPLIIEAVRRQAEVGLSYGAPSELEVEMAELVAEMVPCVEVVRMVSSGTEACMSAIRLARAATGREFIIKFEGCYHGHGDAFLARAGSGLATFGEPTSPGVPRAVAAATLNARYNDLESVRALFETHPGAVAGVIVEPVVGNMGCVAPLPGFLHGLRDLCSHHGALLIFDEVMTGFRLAPGGAMQLFDVTPDLCTLGKVIGGGLPAAAYGGREDLMRNVSPDGPMYQAGTLSGNPLAMAAGLAQLRFLQENPGVYTKLESDGHRIQDAVDSHLRGRGYPARMSRIGSMATLFFTDRDVRCWEDADSCDRQRYAQWFWHLVERGVYMPPAQFEAYFLSAAHTDDDIGRIAEAMISGLDHVFGGA